MRRGGGAFEEPSPSGKLPSAWLATSLSRLPTMPGAGRQGKRTSSGIVASPGTLCSRRPARSGRGVVRWESAVDYRKFLAQDTEVVLPYFGGTRLDARDRPLRLAAPLESPGWYRFRIQGRDATAGARAEPGPVEDLPRQRGYLLEDRLIIEGARAAELFFLPAEEPPRFAPVLARRWPSGELLFDQLEFESEAEEAVRRALEEEGPLVLVKGVPAPLRAAYGYALLGAASERLHVPMSFAEARPYVLQAAQEGRAGAEAALRALAAERLQAQREIEELLRRQRAERDAEVRRARQQAHLQAQRDLDRQVQAQREGREDELRRHGFRGVEVAGRRARQALEDAGARVHATRQLESGLLEVTYTFLGERFISVVQAATLQVVDSGICLGHPPRDELVTLDSLPSVIKEAIDTGRLVKLRHA